MKKHLSELTLHEFRVIKNGFNKIYKTTDKQHGCYVKEAQSLKAEVEKVLEKYQSNEDLDNLLARLDKLIKESQPCKHSKEIRQ